MLGDQRPEEGISDPPRTGVTDCQSHRVELGIEPGSYGGAVSMLCHWAISPALVCSAICLFWHPPGLQPQLTTGVELLC